MIFLVPCALGSYFNKETHQCLPCPAGTYQSETGQMQCTVCPTIAGRPGVTIDVGARSASQCKGRPLFKFVAPRSEKKSDLWKRARM